MTRIQKLVTLSVLCMVAFVAQNAIAQNYTAPSFSGPIETVSSGPIGCCCPCASATASSFSYSTGASNIPISLRQNCSGVCCGWTDLGGSRFGCQPSKAACEAKPGGVVLPDRYCRSGSFTESALIATYASYMPVAPMPTVPCAPPSAYDQNPAGTVAVLRRNCTGKCCAYQVGLSIVYRCEDTAAACRNNGGVLAGDHYCRNSSIVVPATFTSSVPMATYSSLPVTTVMEPACTGVCCGWLNPLTGSRFGCKPNKAACEAMNNGGVLDDRWCSPPVESSSFNESIPLNRCSCYKSHVGDYCVIRFQTCTAGKQAVCSETDSGGCRCRCEWSNLTPAYTTGAESGIAGPMAYTVLPTQPAARAPLNFEATAQIRSMWCPSTRYLEASPSYSNPCGYVQVPNQYIMSVHSHGPYYPGCGLHSTICLSPKTPGSILNALNARPVYSD